MLCSPLEAREGKNLYYAVPSSDTEIKKIRKKKKPKAAQRLGTNTASAEKNTSKCLKSKGRKNMCQWHTIVLRN